MSRYFIVFKPYGMISQFSPEGEHQTLAHLSFNFPKDAYPVGRLDTDSEGLLLLTNDKSINHKLLDPSKKHLRTYWAQVEGLFTEEAGRALEKGVSISVDGKKYQTLPCRVQPLPSPEKGGQLGERNPPIRLRKNIPTSWIQLSLHEGKNRQVRKMTAAVGLPTLRLVRWAIGTMDATGMKTGEVKEISLKEVNEKLLG